MFSGFTDTYDDDFEEDEGEKNATKGRSIYI